jgi:Ca-activated chloride channel family protein
VNVSTWAGAVLVAIGLGTAPRVQGQRPAFVSGVELVNFGVTVTDRKGNFVTTLGQDDFEIYEDGHRQAIRYFLPAGRDSGLEGGPATELHLGVLLDLSGSMEADMRQAKNAAVKFLGTLTGANDITLVDFDTEVRIARYDASNFPRLVERIRSRTAEGNTALYDAVGVYLDNASTEQGRKILVLYTDGADNQSEITFDDLRKLLRASDATVYTIGFFANASTAARLALQGRLQEIAEITGGQFFDPSSMKDLEASYGKVKAEIGAQYSIGYLSTNQRADGSWRKVEIKIVGPERKDLKLRSRRGYFAPYREGGDVLLPSGAARGGAPRR